MSHGLASQIRRNLQTMLSYTRQFLVVMCFQFVLAFISVAYIGLKNPLPNERLAECHDHATDTRA
jgi:hypothetical protein